MNGQPSHIRVGVLALQGAFIEHIGAFEQLCDQYPDRFVLHRGAEDGTGCARRLPDEDDVLWGACPTEENRRVCLEIIEVRTGEQLSQESLDGLVLPGGESTTMAIAAARLGLWEPLCSWIAGQRPTFGTCAGLILLSNAAKSLKCGGQGLLGGIAVEVNRNYYGRQGDSFQHQILLYDSDLHFSSQVGDQLAEARGAEGIFIRAPFIEKINDLDKVKVLARLPRDARVDKQWVEDPVVAVRQGCFLGLTFHPELLPGHTLQFFEKLH